MKDKFFISVITPTFQHEAFISDCIQSVLDQTFNDWEMIIIDDGSRDNTVETARRFAQTDDRIKIITQENKGIYKLAENYNTALAQSRGNWIAILEGDDTWRPEKLQRQVNLLKQNPDVVLCYSQAQVMNSDGKPAGIIVPDYDPMDLNKFNNSPPGNFFSFLNGNNVIPAASALIQKYALEKIGGFKQEFGLPLVDFPTWLELAQKGPFLFIPEVLCHWRKHGAQITRNHTIKISEGLLKQAQHYFDRLGAQKMEKLGVYERKIHAHFGKRIVRNSFFAACHAWKNNDHDEAKRLFLKAMTTPHGWSKWKIISPVCYALLKSGLPAFPLFLRFETM